MSFRNFLPVEDYVLITNLTADQVLNRIGGNIQPAPRLSFPSIRINYTKPYSGHITGRTFTMSRNISHRNSFLPVITGEITTFTGQTQVRIKMRPASFVLIFMSVWLGIIGLACIGILLIGIVRFGQILQEGFSPMLLVPFGMFAFGCVLIHFGFKSESKNSKLFLAKLLESKS